MNKTDTQKLLDTDGTFIQVNTSEVKIKCLLATAKNNRETRRVMTSGIRFNNRLYFSPELINHIGENVTILYSRLTDESISVIKDREFICEAPLAEKLKLVNESEEKLKEHMQMQKNAKRQAKEALNIPFEQPVDTAKDIPIEEKAQQNTPEKD